MKRWRNVICTVIAGLVFNAWAQQIPNKDRVVAKTASKDVKSLDINNMELFISNDGIFGESPTGSAGLFFPTGQEEKSILYTAGLWVVGKMDGDIRTAACQYASEFQPGPILPNGFADNPADVRYQIYRYSRGDVIDQQAIDLGCPSQILGDQMLFAVFNDLGAHSSLYQKDPIGLEVQLTAWAFDRQGAVGNTVFLRYRMINKNRDGQSLDSAYIGLWYDPDLGGSNDDAVGCDPDLNLAYVFNGDTQDSQYGLTPPAMGSIMLKGPSIGLEGNDQIPDSPRVMGAFSLHL